MFGAGRDQTIEHHRTGEPLHRCGEAGLAQNAVEFEALPELVADMNGPALRWRSVAAPAGSTLIAAPMLVRRDDDGRRCARASVWLRRIFTRETISATAALSV
jgi:hypothetical protein